MSAKPPRVSGRRCGCPLWVLALSALLQTGAAHAMSEPPRGATDSRVRIVGYDADQVYRLHGYVGYQIDVEFAPGERFVGLGAGDIDALSFAGERNHLFLKPKAAKVATNITVLTTLRTYQFDYTAATLPAGGGRNDVIYALRFRYPEPNPSAAAAARRLDRQLRHGSAGRPRNRDYWYCGDPGLKPTAAWDDGVHTHLRFAAHSPMPAVFIRNDDGSESLLNFSIDGGDVVLHRVAKRFVLRRGRSTGCIVDAGFTGGGVRLKSGTVAADVRRIAQGGSDEHR